MTGKGGMADEAMPFNCRRKSFVKPRTDCAGEYPVRVWNKKSIYPDWIFIRDVLYRMNGMEKIMECISISFRSAPEETRKRFAFPAGETGIKERTAFLEKAGEAVLLSTCNRTEVYAAGEGSFGRLEELLSEKSGMPSTEVKRLARRFVGEKACAHLYRVACGMDSMVVGEDEILGQVRAAYLFSSERGFCGYELNTVFQGRLPARRRLRRKPFCPKPRSPWRPLPARRFSGSRSFAEKLRPCRTAPAKRPTGRQGLPKERRPERRRIRGRLRCCSSEAAGGWEEAC